MLGITWFKKWLSPTPQDSLDLRGEVLSRIEAYRFNLSPEKTLAESMDSDRPLVSRSQPPAA